MAQFDLYKYNKPGSAVEYLLDIQSDLLCDMESRVVIPLYKLKTGQNPIKTLQPLVELPTGLYFLSTSELAAVPGHNLGVKIGSFHQLREEVIAALDRLFTGV
ncbi:MAG: CcdB family protein [Magnetococcales bacterium]|nr:CcdB family protein [Magnetococcales bacterium]